MADVSSLLSALSSVGWLLLGVVVVIVAVRAVRPRMKDLVRLGAGPSGVTMEFAERALDEAVSRPESQQPALGNAAKRGILERLRRNADLLERAKVMWVDDVPANNASIVDLLARFKARVDTPRSNDEAFELMAANRYDVVITDVARKGQGPRSDLVGIDLAEQVFARTGQKVLIFSARFNPLTFPGLMDEERIDLAQTVERTVFGRTNRYDEALHLVLDILERGI